MNLALIHLKRGERARAIQSLETSLYVYPDYTYARSVLRDAEVYEDSLLDSEGFAFVFNDLLERFGEITTVVFE